MLDEVLGQGDDFRIKFAEVGRVLNHPDLVGPGTGHQAGSRGAADGLLAIGPVEAHAFLGEFIQVRGLSDRRTIATELGPQVVDSDEKDVRTIGRTVRNR